MSPPPLTVPTAVAECDTEHGVRYSAHPGYGCGYQEEHIEVNSLYPATKILPYSVQYRIAVHGNGSFTASLGCGVLVVLVLLMC
jgi:hypothetical protein